MDTTGKTKPDPRPGTPARPDGSGEGARSALEQLIQRERKRDAQAPREAGGAGTAPRTS